MRLGILAAIVWGCGGATVETPARDDRSQLCVVRHAQAVKNLSVRPEGLSDAQLDALTSEGASSARRVGASLPPDVAVVWSSPAGRARETAALLGLAPTVTVEPGLRMLEGEVAWEARLETWSRGEDPRPEGGESLADGASRVRALLLRLREAVPPGQHAVVVTHGDIASLLVGELRGTPLLERPSRDTLGTGELTCLPLGGAAQEAS